MLELRDYANEGGKLLVDGRNVHQPFTSTQRQPVGAPARTPGRRTSCSASTTRRTTRATTTCPAPPGSVRARSPTTRGRTTSASIGRSRRQRRHAAPKFDTAPVTPAAGSIFAGMTPFTLDTAAGQPNQAPTAGGCRADQVAAAPAQLEQRLAQRAAARRRRCRPTTRPRPRRRPTAARSSPRVTR